MSADTELMRARLDFLVAATTTPINSQPMPAWTLHGVIDWAIAQNYARRWEPTGCFALTTAGRDCLQMLRDELKAVRSRNNNCFYYSRYWGTWSRVLLYRPHGTRADNPSAIMARRFAVPDVLSVEINLTAVNPTSVLDWASNVQFGTIRCHGTAQENDGRDFVGTLPGGVVHMMEEWLTADAIDKLLHGDYLPFIDWDKHHKANNGGASFAAAIREPISIQHFYEQRKLLNPRLEMAHVRQAHADYVELHNKNVRGLTIVNGLLQNKE